MPKKVVTILSLCLVVGMLFAAIPVAASPSPFGNDVTPLTTDELNTVEGEFHPAAGAALAGSIISTANYLITTPSSEWSVSGAVRNAIAGAVSGLAGFLVK